MREAAEQIRQAIPTRILAESLGVRVDRKGEALCPFHGDTNKSLHIYKDPKRGWVCFGCHRGGTVIDFAMQWYGITFRQAVVRLDADFNLGLPLGRKPTPQERRRAKFEREKRQQEELKRRNTQKTAEFAFWRAFDRYAALLTIVEQTRPKQPNDEISARYAAALILLPIAKDEYQRAEYELEKLREEANGHGTATDAA